MDMDEPKGPIDPSASPLTIKTMLGYAGSIGTALWYEVGRDCGKVWGSRFILERCCSDKSLSARLT
jgi:hypothetical protein